MVTIIPSRICFFLIVCNRVISQKMVNLQSFHCHVFIVFPEPDPFLIFFIRSFQSPLVLLITLPVWVIGSRCGYHLFQIWILFQIFLKLVPRHKDIFSLFGFFISYCIGWHLYNPTALSALFVFTHLYVYSFINFKTPKVIRVSTMSLTLLDLMSSIIRYLHPIH